ncbi:T9SS type A sorting domain-containing protein [uncultured Pontibacter sp.]|uniref:T9SS type A sorting domain-containing protein n=1 Tax=uncultured Pontibacter sp. TaxID=453356 RepID=UPI002639EDB4|nr:T9SS type A sorting domain-containing protein [uncultured Pontibacter sp.]
MKYKFTLFQKIFGCVLAVGFLFSSAAAAQVSMGKYNTHYSQNFDGFPVKEDGVWASGTEYFAGWRLHRTKTELIKDGIRTDLNTLVVNPGTSNTGNLFNYGSSNATDRALGALGSSNAGEFAYGLLLQNNTGSTISALDLSYVGEQWRTGNRTTGIHHITFWYAISSDKNAFNLWPSGDKGWTQVPELTFFSPIYFTAGMALDGNAAANRKMLFHTLPVTIPAGSYIMLRWKDADEPEADHGLAIDDFSLNWRTDANSGPIIMPVELMSFTATPNKNRVELHWKTASEQDNNHFVVERSADGHLFEGIGLVNGTGTSSRTNSYTLTDEHPLNGTSYYRLKQVDTNGKFTYSRLVSVSKVFAKEEVQVYPTITASALNIQQSALQKYSYATVIDVMGKQVLQVPLDAAKVQSIHVGHLGSGTYVLVLQDEKGNRVSKRFKKV